MGKIDQLASRQIEDSVVMKHRNDPSEMAGKQSNDKGGGS
jgi:hypothetical protein